MCLFVGLLPPGVRRKMAGRSSSRHSPHDMEFMLDVRGYLRRGFPGSGHTEAMDTDCLLHGFPPCRRDLPYDSLVGSHRGVAILMAIIGVLMQLVRYKILGRLIGLPIYERASACGCSNRSVHCVGYDYDPNPEFYSDGQPPDRFNSFCT